MLCHLPPRHLRLCCDTPMCSEDRNKLNVLTHLFIKHLPSACHALCSSRFSKCGVRAPGVHTSVPWVSQAESQKRYVSSFQKFNIFQGRRISFSCSNKDTIGIECKGYVSFRHTGEFSAIPPFGVAVTLA